VIDQNNRQLLRFYSMIESEFIGREHVRIGLLGLAFKSQTSDCRESPAIALAKLMLWRGWEVVAYDPGVRFRPSELPERVRLVSTLSAAAAGADALVVATEWPEFARADLGMIRGLMDGDIVFDGRCVIDPERCVTAGLRYIGICAPSQDQHDDRPISRSSDAQTRPVSMV
jgi:UDPglucose 6-dehydrogenase